MLLARYAQDVSINLRKTTKVGVRLFNGRAVQCIIPTLRL